MEISDKTGVQDDGQCTLVIMAKAPRPGMVKTRLTRHIPPTAVTALYRCLLDDTLALAKSLKNVEVAIVCPALDVDDLACVASDSVRVVPQTGDGLAAGLTSVFAHFAGDGRRRIIAFNSDSPHLPVSVLETAFRTLADYDMVVGPTYDGGYYLVGAKASQPELFRDDKMGTSNALDTLLGRVRALGLSVWLADSFYDIDIASDLIQLDSELHLSPAKAPKTAAWLARWRESGSELIDSAGPL